MATRKPTKEELALHLAKGGESNFDKLQDKIEDEGYSKEAAGAIAYDAGVKKYGKAGMEEKAEAGRKAAGYATGGQVNDGSNFDKLRDKIEGEGYSDEAATKIAAKIGDEKYGVEGMARKAAAARKEHEGYADGGEIKPDREDLDRVLEELISACNEPDEDGHDLEVAPGETEVRRVPGGVEVEHRSPIVAHVEELHRASGGEVEDELTPAERKDRERDARQDEDDANESDREYYKEKKEAGKETPVEKESHKVEEANDLKPQWLLDRELHTEEEEDEIHKPQVREIEEEHEEEIEGDEQHLKTGGIVKVKGGWENKKPGKPGHGKFATKKAAAAQTRAMYANGYAEGGEIKMPDLDRDFERSLAHDPDEEETDVANIGFATGGQIHDPSPAEADREGREHDRERTPTPFTKAENEGDEDINVGYRGEEENVDDLLSRLFDVGRDDEETVAHDDDEEETDVSDIKFATGGEVKEPKIFGMMNRKRRMRKGC